MEVPVLVTHGGSFVFFLDTVHNTSGFRPCFGVTNSRHFADEIGGHKPV